MHDTKADPGRSSVPEFDPGAELEFLLAGARDGRVSIITLYQVLLRSPLYALFDRPMDASGETEETANALVFETGDVGKLLAAFTESRHARLIGADLGEFVHSARLTGEALVNALGPDTGLILNPGHALGMKLPSASLARLRQVFGTRGQPASGDDTAGENLPFVPFN